MKSYIKLLLVLLAICTLLCSTSCSFIISKLIESDRIENESGIEIESENTDKSFEDIIEDIANLNKVFNQYYYYELDEEALGEALLKAYVDATGDKFAAYYTPEEFEELTNENNGDLVGIGVSVVNTTVEINGYSYKVMEIISVFKDSPALEAGVKVGDLIMYVGAGDDKVSINQVGYDKAVNNIRGEEGTIASITVLRKNKDTELYDEVQFSIERRKVKTETVTYTLCTTDSRVGIVRISEFNLTTPTQFSEAVDALLSMGCEYFIFDVRYNPGGDLNSIVAVQSYFLNKGDLCVSIKSNEKQSFDDEKKIYCQPVKYTGSYEGCSVSSKDIGKYKDLKCAVLTNSSTASAAELFTETMRDYGRAVIVGETTYGKGCMQTIVTLTESKHGVSGALRVTSALYFSASHTDYHEIGIVPDVKVELSEEALGYNFFLIPHDVDNQLQAAIEQITK